MSVDPTPLRVLHCPHNVAGHPAGLARGERAIGLDSRAVALTPTAFGFEADETLCPPGASAIARELARRGLLARALAEADVTHFNWGENLLPPPPPRLWTNMKGPLRSRLATWAMALLRAPVAYSDLARLDRAGKVIAVTFQGDDIRQGDAQRARYPQSLADVAPENYAPAVDAWKRRRIAAFDAHADIIYALNPDLLHDLPARARFLPYASADVAALTPRPPRGPRPRIAHAPTNRTVKGTEHVLAAVDALRAEGLAFDFELIEGLPHDAALERYAEADILVDQLHAGFYGGLAVELMAMGKTVVCHLRDADLGFLDPAMRAELPIVRADPVSLADTLGRLVREDPEARAARGARSRAFAERWHDPRAVAARTRADYEAALSRRAERAGRR